jgi:hypothetical protein
MVLEEIKMSKYDYSELFMFIFIGFIIITFGFLYVDVAYATQSEEYSDNYIISLKDTMFVNGRFALGSGYIDEKPAFIYYQVVNNGYQLKSVPADQTIVIEDENDKPYIKETLSVNYARLSGMRSVNSYKTKYEIHVPKDTIVKNFNLDSEK